MSKPLLAVILTVCVAGVHVTGTAQRAGGAAQPQPFKGLTADGTIEAGLFPIKATGVSTRPVRESAQRFLQALTAEQRTKTTYAVDDDEWLKWNNVHRYARQGVNVDEMTEAQRERAFDLMRASLSAKGFERSRAVMKLNGHLADLLNRHDEYGEWLYHLTVMGAPSDTEPWGWQLDGHHLIVNYFVLGDQVVMTPTFMGSEPVTATEGRYAGTSIMQDEQNKGLAFMRALSDEHRPFRPPRPPTCRSRMRSETTCRCRTSDFPGRSSPSDNGRCCLNSSANTSATWRTAMRRSAWTKCDPNSIAHISRGPAVRGMTMSSTTGFRAP